ncbi:MAG TPA: TetR/AcrR family transcriptional regulator [Acidimicrobiia bacterium]|nr:TetR/AcrR family transcriptional regulator [Acidimicrobiia bacterium]
MEPQSDDDVRAHVHQRVQRSLDTQYRARVDEVERFLRAGVEVIRRTESIDPRITEIIEESGLSNKTFYRHFESKDDLLVAILVDGLRQTVDELTRRMAALDMPDDKVRAWIEGTLSRSQWPHGIANTRPFILMGYRLAHDFPDEWREADRRVRAPLVEAIAQGRRERAFPNADPERDAEAIYHLTMGKLHASTMWRTVPTRDEIDALVTFSLAGLRHGRRRTTRPRRQT